MMEKMDVGRRTQARARLYVDKFLLKNHGSEINEVLAFGYAAMFLAIEVIGEISIEFRVQSC